MAEWLKATDCKSVHESVRWFESTPAQIIKFQLAAGIFLVLGVILTTVEVLSSICLFRINN